MLKQHHVPTTSLHKQLGILKISDSYTYGVASFMHKLSINNLPSSFSKYFIKSKKVRNLGTRRNVSSNLNVPRYKTARLKRSIK